MTTDTLPASQSTPRFDLFQSVHKGIRLALVELLPRLGSTDFTDPGAAGVLVDSLELVLAFSDDHKLAEDAVILPALGERLSGGLDSFEQAHADQARHVEELRATGRALLAAPTMARGVVGRTLYLHFSTFVADCLSHMAEEEQVLSPLFARLFSDEEVRAVHARTMAFLDHEQHARGAPFILRALSRPERAALVAGVVRTMPRQAVEGLLESVRPLLPAEDVDHLVASAGLSS